MKNQTETWTKKVSRPQFFMTHKSFFYSFTSLAFNSSSLLLHLWVLHSNKISFFILLFVLIVHLFILTAKCNFVCITFHSLSPPFSLSAAFSISFHWKLRFLALSQDIKSPPPSRCASKWQIRQVRGRSWNVNYVCRWQPIQSLASVSPLTSPKQNLVKVWGSQKSDYFFIIVRNQSHLETEAAESM